MGDEPSVLGWSQIAEIGGEICERVRRDGVPTVVVGVLRGGMVPAVMACHRLGLRDLRGVDVRHTSSDEVDATKTPEPIELRVSTLGRLAGADVLVMDDIAGSGATVRAAARLAIERGAARVRTAVCVVNRLNWTDETEPIDALNYIGTEVKGWVIFPWETR